jgi:hypothetical protein
MLDLVHFVEIGDDDHGRMKYFGIGLEQGRVLTLR